MNDTVKPRKITTPVPAVVSEIKAEKDEDQKKYKPINMMVI